MNPFTVLSAFDCAAREYGMMDVLTSVDIPLSPSMRQEYHRTLARRQRQAARFYSWLFYHLKGVQK